MAANASELYREMKAEVLREHWQRQSTDDCSALTEPTIEAIPGCKFTLDNPAYNVADFRQSDLRWAKANVLHFLASTERAGILRLYNARAVKYLEGDFLRGAYGPIAMPQIARCIGLLKESMHTRKAIVSFGGFCEPTVNAPPCISFMHYMTSRHGLDLLVYQRSLNLIATMPYDCITLTNLLYYVSKRTHIPMGRLHWDIGSLHMTTTDWPDATGDRHQSLLVDSEDPWNELITGAERA